MPASPSSRATPAASPQRIDGRVRRGERNRKKIIDALYDLVRAGVVRPTAEMVANHAAVGDRTVFRHFQDMETLHDGMSARLTKEVLQIIAGEPQPTGDLENRLRQLVRLRSRIFEHIAPFRRTARAFAGTPAVRGEPHVEIDAHMRAALETVLAPDIDQLPKELLEGLDALLSFETWDRLRVNQALGPLQSLRTLERSSLALIRGARS